MNFKIVGNPEPITRVETGLYSFDRAFTNKAGALGLPVHGIMEVSGFTGTGKTTTSLSLAGILGAKLEKNIAFAPIEKFDPEYTQKIIEGTDFAGELHYVSEETDEKMLTSLVNKVFDDELPFCVGIFDSIGALSPISELQGDFGEANMGRRAKLLAQFSRRIDHKLMTKPHRLIIVNNHLHPNIGGRGWSTPGGETIKFISSMQMGIKVCEKWDDGSFAIEGTVRKNRFGFNERQFWMIILSGFGVHRGLTALYDGYKCGVVNRKGWVKIGDENFGRLKEVFQKARDGDTEFFQPFYDVLNETTT